MDKKKYYTSKYPHYFKNTLWQNTSNELFVTLDHLCKKLECVRKKTGLYPEISKIDSAVKDSNYASVINTHRVNDKEYKGPPDDLYIWDTIIINLISYHNYTFKYIK